MRKCDIETSKQHIQPPFFIFIVTVNLTNWLIAYSNRFISMQRRFKCFGRFSVSRKLIFILCCFCYAFFSFFYSILMLFSHLNLFFLYLIHRFYYRKKTNESIGGLIWAFNFGDKNTFLFWFPFEQHSINFRIAN